MKILVSTCLLLTLLPPVASLLCEMCLRADCKQRRVTMCGLFDGDEYDRNPDIKPGDVFRPAAIDLDETAACYTEVIDFPMDGIPRNETYLKIWGCRSRKNCHSGKYTASLVNGGYIYKEVRCCYTDFCNVESLGEDPLVVPNQEDRKLNEMQCPGSLSTRPQSEDRCSKQTTVRCRDHENQCVEFDGRPRTPLKIYPIIHFRGCASESLCALLRGETRNELLTFIEINVAHCNCARYKTTV